jgi:uncharacterized protein YlxP (DUF503 family)
MQNEIVECVECVEIAARSGVDSWEWEVAGVVIISSNYRQLEEQSGVLWDSI